MMTNSTIISHRQCILLFNCPGSKRTEVPSKWDIIGEVSRILDVEISYFFEQYNEKQKPANFKYGFADTDQNEFLDTGKWYDKETLELIRIYYSIQDQKLRRNLVKVIQNMAEMQSLGKAK